MKAHRPAWLGILLLVAAVGLAEDRIAPAKRQPAVRPLPVPAGGWRLRVQEKALFPKQTPGKASQAASEKGLSLVVQPEKAKFGGNGPLAFRVTLTNHTKGPIVLVGAKHLGRDPKLVISNLQNAKQWTLSMKTPESGGAVVLEPGKSYECSLVVERVVKAVPLPRPVPKPLPGVPRPLRKRLDDAGAADRAAAAEPAVAAPKRAIIAPAPAAIPVGTGKCRALLLLEFQTDPRARFRFPTWTGKIAARPVEFTVTQAGPAPPAVILPPGPGPVTKQKAIAVAKPVAERALTTHYNQQRANTGEAILPAHQGDWIEKPADSAQVKKRAGGGWTVRFASFPARGFSYNVVIDVAPSGAATVREVFTGYSRR